VAGIGAWWINRAPRIHRDESETLPLFTGLGPSVSTAATDSRVVAPSVPRAVASSAPAVAPPVVAPPVVAPPAAPRPEIREFTTRSSPLIDATPRQAGLPNTVNAPVVSEAGVPGTMVEGHALRFSVPAEGTLQFLPGRLEIGSGIDAGREIRFVHVPGPNGTEVTFGRTEGPLYRHIQLHDKTVSRQHALLQWRDGHWYLRNLSQTNPVARNGGVLDIDDIPCLQDGDRIEMGEVVFTFRSR
jgi:hypothetical protein